MVSIHRVKEEKNQNYVFQKRENVLLTTNVNPGKGAVNKSLSYLRRFIDLGSDLVRTYD